MFRHPMQGLVVRSVAEEQDAVITSVRDVCEDPDTRASLDRFASGRAGRLCRMLVAQHGKRVAGLAGWQQDEMVGVVQVHLVLPAHRDRGVGTALLVRLIEQARDVGVRFLEAALPEVALRSQRIYRRQGFQEVGQQVDGCIVYEKYLGGKS